MPANNVLKNFNLFVDGRGYAGQGEEYTPPVLQIKQEEWRGAGMDAPEQIDMGMEAIETSFNLLSYDPNILGLFGLVPGGQVGVIIRGALQGPAGVVTPVQHIMRGKVSTMDSGSWKPGEKPMLSCTMSLHFYSLIHGGREIHTIDIRNYIRRINGVDQLAGMRAALGV